MRYLISFCVSCFMVVLTAYVHAETAPTGIPDIRTKGGVTVHALPKDMIAGIDSERYFLANGDAVGCGWKLGLYQGKLKDFFRNAVVKPSILEKDIASFTGVEKAAFVDSRIIPMASGNGIITQFTADSRTTKGVFPRTILMLRIPFPDGKFVQSFCIVATPLYLNKLNDLIHIAGNATPTKN